MISPTRTSNPGSTRVVLWSWSGCPSHDDALRLLHDALDELGRPQEPIEVRWVETEDEAERNRFVGSPTFRVDGADVVPAGDEQFALTCRIYRSASGRVSPLPERSTLVAALAERLAPGR